MTFELIKKFAMHVFYNRITGQSEQTKIGFWIHPILSVDKPYFLSKIFSY